MAADRSNTLARVRDGEQVLGTWCSLADGATVEIVARSGFEIAFIDLEHGEIGTHQLPGLLRAAAVGGATGMVRVRFPEQIGPALDAGAAGVMLPDVRSAAAATALVAACRFPPVGGRGAAPMVRGAGYATRPFTDLLAAPPPLVMAQIEGPDGMAALDDVLGVDGLDLVFVGPFDLSQHLGVPGEVTHPSVVAAVSEITQAARERGVATGVWAPDAAAARTWLDAGVGLVTVSNVAAMLAGAAGSLMESLRQG